MFTKIKINNMYFKLTKLAIIGSVKLKFKTPKSISISYYFISTFA